MKLKSEDITKIAEVAYEIIAGYCRYHGEYRSPWDACSEDVKQSFVDGVIGHAQLPDMTPETNYISWLSYKEQNGWTFGYKKNASLKKHPSMEMSYQDLPAEQQVKHFIFSATVKAMLSQLASLVLAIFVTACSHFPEVDISPELEVALCVEACHVARDRGCERIGKLDFTGEACESACEDYVANLNGQDWGCFLEAGTCRRLGTCTE